MQLGTSLLLIAVGAILRWGVSDAIEGVNLPVIGLILMIIGVVGLVLSLFLMNRARTTDRVVTREYRDPPPPAV